MKKKELQALGKKLGVVVVEQVNGGSYDITAEAPHRKLWAAAFVHELVAWSYAGPKKWYEEARKDIAERMEMGFIDCEVPECDWCNPTEE